MTTETTNAHDMEKRARQAYLALRRNGIKVDPKGLVSAGNMFLKIIGEPNVKD